jgi:ring-1,2-phenylacetyl-CoA epoxidase subunit PaaE
LPRRFAARNDKAFASSALMAAAIPRFHTLTVADLRAETSDAVSIAFAVPPDLAADYAFAPGQYLTLRRTIEGEDMRRSYSICAGPDDGELRIAVKRVPGGPFSTWATTELRAGEAVEVMTPTGRFGAHLGAGQVYAGFAAGSGITPILSILRGVLARQADSRFFLFYGNRTSNDMLFREALEELKDRHLGRLSVFHVLSQEQQDVPVLTGRLDPERVRLLLTHIVPAPMVDHAFVCGPEGMSEGVATALRDLGLPDERVHIERFVSALSGRPAPRRPVPPTPAGEAPHCIATVILDGKRTDVPVAEGEAVLDAALRAGLDLPYACKGGMCCTCRARLVEGAATMAVNYSLEKWEMDAGFVLTCQSHPTTPRVVLDYDQA